MALELIKISEFPQVTEPSDWIVVSGSDGVAYKISKADFKAWLGTVQSIAPREISPTDPEPGLSGLYIPTEDGDYPLIGLDVDRSETGADYGQYVQFINDNGTWSKVNTPLPAGSITEWVPGSYGQYEWRAKDGQLWQAVVPTSEEPGSGSDWIPKVNITPKVDTSNVAWGVSDNSPDRNIAIYLDNKGYMYFNASKEARLSISNIEDQEPTNKFDYAISDNSANKFTIFGLKDGKVWTPRGWIDPQSIATTPTTDVATQLPPDNSPNGIYNQWVAPMMVYSSGSYYFTSIGRSGEIYLHRKDGDGFIYRRQIGEGEGDDHNNACVLIDDRPEAEYPIMVFQSNHQTTPMRYCKLNSLNPDDWVDIEWSIMAGGDVSYAQAFRYGNEIIVHCRTDVYQVEGESTRGIRWYYSNDNGTTWEYKTIFERAGHTQPYIQLKEKSDKTGINIAINSHPLVFDYSGIRFITLDWTSGTMSGTVGGSAIVLDFREIFTNPSWVPLDTFNTGLEVLVDQGGVRKRLLDVTRSPSGETRVLYAIWPESGNLMDAFRAAEYRVIDFDMNTGAIEFDVSLGEVGMPLERPAGGNMYIAGGCFLETRKVALARYRNQSYLEGGSNTTGNDGFTDLRISQVHSATNINTFEGIIEFGGKGGRPVVSVEGNMLMMCQMDSYISYTDYKSNLRIYNTKNFKTWE